MIKNIMLITCEKCQAIYSIAEKVIGENGRVVKCAKCAHTWIVKVEEAKEAEEVHKHQQIKPLPINHKNSTALKILISLLLVAICLVSFIAFHDRLSQFFPLRQVYEKIGIYNNDGLSLNNFIYQIKDDTLLIAGKISNNSGVDKLVPDVRYTLLDKNRMVIFSAVAKSSKKTIKNGETIPVQAKIANLSDEAAYLQLDLFNKLELSLQYK